MTASYSVKINAALFEVWMTAILSVIKSDTILQGMAAIRVVK